MTCSVRLKELRQTENECVDDIAIVATNRRDLNIALTILSLTLEERELKINAAKTNKS